MCSRLTRAIYPCLSAERHIQIVGARHHPEHATPAVRADWIAVVLAAAAAAVLAVLNAPTSDETNIAPVTGSNAIPPE